MPTYISAIYSQAYVYLTAEEQSSLVATWLFLLREVATRSYKFKFTWLARQLQRVNIYYQWLKTIYIANGFTNY